MSTLGIKFALPYKGANGIKVQGNIIEINPLESIKFYDGNDFVTSNNKSIINKDGFNVIIDNSYVDITAGYVTINDDNNNTQADIEAQAIYLTNLTNGNNLSIFPDSINIFDVTNNQESHLTTKQISFNDVNSDGGLNLVDGSINDISQLNTGAVIPATDKYLMITISGSVYKLIIAQ